MIKHNDIFSYITAEETNFTQPIQVIDNWDWSMRDHITTTILYKNSIYLTGKDDNKPFKNIILAILRLQYRAEGFDLKDIEMFVDDAKNYYKSFLVKKYHEKWARENRMDTFIDSMVESYVDFGGILVKKTSKAVPEIVSLQSIVFCDQTDILSGPIGIKHFYSPDQLKDMESVGWGNKKHGATHSIDELIVLAQEDEDKIKDKQTGKVSKTPGKYIEIYEIHGTLPETYLIDEEKVDEENKYTSQIQIVAFYQDETGAKRGITLFKKKEVNSPFKLLLRDEIFGRALGLGGAEELFEAQVWTNYDIIRTTEMLDSASKVLHQTDDASFANANKTTDMDNGDILVLDEGKKIGQVDTYPHNINLFDKSIADWEMHAQQLGSAQDPIMGETPKSGTPFKLQQAVIAQASGLHEYRKGKLAVFLDEIYQDWIIPHIAKEVSKEQNFSAMLDLKEMQAVVESITTTKANNLIKERILSGQAIKKEEINALKEKTRENFMKGDNKKFIKILKDEMKDAPICVKTNIAGKQEYLSVMVDKLGNVFRTIASNPQILQQPAMAELFNRIIEASGLSPIDFSSIKELPPPPPQQTNQQGIGQPPVPANT